MSARPDLSIILCGRNDGYGENYLQRLQCFVSSLTMLSEAYDLSSELIFVEWNPPADRERMQYAIDWGRAMRTKIITVPAEVDRELGENSGNSGLHEFIAKNVGIRRATGTFVLCTNSDVVWTPSLVAFLANTTLASDAFYRATRVGIHSVDNAALGRPDTLLHECMNNVANADFLAGTVKVNGKQLQQLGSESRTLPFGREQLFRKFFGFRDADEPLRCEAVLLRQFPHLIFTNAAGDFMLMAKEAWESIGGYLETSCRNHVDAWLCFEAVRHGLAQVLLPLSMCVFHQEHYQPELREYYGTLRELSGISASPSWGLADHRLEEQVISTDTGRVHESV